MESLKKSFKGEAAYQFDLRLITHEQGVIAKPFYAKASAETINDFQEVADQKWLSWNSAALGAKFFNHVTPSFSQFNASVSDFQFRIDLPMLMLWLDRHIPIWVGFLNSGGKTVRADVKKTIREYYNRLNT